MEVRIHKSAGYRNDLLVVIPRSEIEDVLFHIANRGRLMELPGLLRGTTQDPAEREMVNNCKVPVEEHLRLLTESLIKAGRKGLVNSDGEPQRRFLVVGTRNVGNNHGFVAWQKDHAEPSFHVRGDPLNYSFYSCLTRQRDGQVAIRKLRFLDGKVVEDAEDVTADIDWCVYANWVLRDGQVIGIDEIIGQFYDLRHVLAFQESPGNKGEEAKFFEGYA